MSFCCPSGYGCNHVPQRGFMSPRGECYRKVVKRCDDAGLADLAEAWAVRHDETPWWRSLKRLHYVRRYRRAVLMAYDAGIRPRMVRPPWPTVLVPLTDRPGRRPAQSTPEPPAFPVDNPPRPSWVLS